MSDITTFRTFLGEQNEDRDIQYIPHQELDSLMSRFITAAHRQDGRPYESETLRGMIGSVDRYLKMHKYPFHIRHGDLRDFPLTKESLNVKQKILRNGNNRPPKKRMTVTDEDIERLYTSGTLSMDNPTGLLNLLIFNIGIHLGLRVKEQNDLRWGDIVLLKDFGGKQYLEYTGTPTSPNVCENPTNRKQVKMCIFSTPHNPDRDPIAAYIKYTNCRPESMMAPDSPFYLAPNHYKPLYFQWFHTMKIGINKLRRLMKDMKYDSVLRKKYDRKRFKPFT